MTISFRVVEMIRTVLFVGFVILLLKTKFDDKFRVRSCRLTTLDLNLGLETDVSSDPLDERSEDRTHVFPRDLPTTSTPTHRVGESESS